MADKKTDGDDGGFDIWDIALPVVAALAGRKVGRYLRGRTAKGKLVYDEIGRAQEKARGADKAYALEYDQAKKRLRDAVAGRVKLSEAEELDLRRRLSDYSEEIPGTASPALKNIRDANEAAWDAEFAKNRYLRPASVGGLVAGGAVGYGANASRDKYRKKRSGQ